MFSWSRTGQNETCPAPREPHTLGEPRNCRLPQRVRVWPLLRQAGRATPRILGTVEDVEDGHPAKVVPLAAIQILEDETAAVAETWEELCRWDPLLPPDVRPPMAVEVITAVARALARPQPLGWGADPEIERLVEGFAIAAGSVDLVVGQLVCLREALRIHVQGRVPAAEQYETVTRMTMVVDRAIGVAARRMSTRLEEEAHLDPLTGLLNRRALSRDLERELGRAGRHSRFLTVIVVDLDGLKTVNDRGGHAAGDRALRAMAEGLNEALRVGDQAYRIGGDEFVAMLPEATSETAETVALRVARSGGPRFTWGSATFPDDGEDPDELIDLADHRLLAKRAR